MNIENMCLIPVMIVRIPVMREAEKDKLREKIVSGILDGVLLIEDGLSYEVVDLPMEDRRLHHHAVINWTGPGDYGGALVPKIENHLYNSRKRRG